MKKFAIDNSKAEDLPFTPEEDSDLRWTFLNIYNLRELKDSYLVVKQNQGKSVKEICEIISKDVIPEKKDWEGKKKKGRKALEPLTALKKFGLVDSKNFVIKETFKGSLLNEDLSNEDKNNLKDIFFNYFRFKEMSAWLISPESTYSSKNIISSINEYFVREASKPIYYFTNNSRFYNRFIYDIKDNTKVYKIPDNATHIMRFWEVFIKWGTVLNLIEKFNLEHTDYRLYNSDSSSEAKSFSCAYFLSDLNNLDNIDTISFAKNLFESKRIYLPELVLQICLHFRVPVESSKNLVISQGRKHKDFIGFERTSEIFVKVNDFKKKQKETIFFPKFQDSYISHLNLR